MISEVILVRRFTNDEECNQRSSTGAPEIPININQKVELGFEHNRPCKVNVDLTWSM